jgi:hypothetical protein
MSETVRFSERNKSLRDGRKKSQKTTYIQGFEVIPIGSRICGERHIHNSKQLPLRRPVSTQLLLVCELRCDGRLNREA